MKIQSKSGKTCYFNTLFLIAMLTILLPVTGLSIEEEPLVIKSFNRAPSPKEEINLDDIPYKIIHESLRIHQGRENWELIIRDANGLSRGGRKIQPGDELIIPAPIPPEKVDEVRDTAVRAFRALDCSGMARVDFFYDRKTGRMYLNELNTIPGFTSISMYAKLWEASGIPYVELIDRLIQLAVERHEERKSLEITYSIPPKEKIKKE